DGRIVLHVNKPVAVVAPGEAFDEMPFVLPSAAADVVRDAGIENERLAGHDVDPTALVHPPTPTRHPDRSARSCGREVEGSRRAVRTAGERVARASTPMLNTFPPFRAAKVPRSGRDDGC